MPIRTKTDYTDIAKRVGSEESIITKIVETILVILVGLFIAAIVGSMIWGNEGFVYLLAGLLN